MKETDMNSARAKSSILNVILSKNVSPSPLSPEMNRVRNADKHLALGYNPVPHRQHVRSHLNSDVVLKQNRASRRSPQNLQHANHTPPHYLHSPPSQDRRPLSPRHRSIERPSTMPLHTLRNNQTLPTVQMDQRQFRSPQTRRKIPPRKRRSPRHPRPRGVPPPLAPSNNDHRAPTVNTKAHKIQRRPQQLQRETAPPKRSDKESQSFGRPVSAIPGPRVLRPTAQGEDGRRGTKEST